MNRSILVTEGIIYTTSAFCQFSADGLRAYGVIRGTNRSKVYKRESIDDMYTEIGICKSDDTRRWLDGGEVELLS